MDPQNGILSTRKDFSLFMEENLVKCCYGYWMYVGRQTDEMSGEDGVKKQQQ